MNLNAAICIEFIIYQQFLSVFAFSYFLPAATDKKDLIPRRLRLAAKFYTKPKHVPTSYI